MRVTLHERSSGSASVVLLAAITMLGLLLRLPSLGNSLFGDEAGTYYIVTGHSLGGILHLQYGHSVDLTPPLYFVLAWLAERFGSSPQLLRLAPLLAGLVAIPLTYAVGARTVGRRAAIAAAALVALSPFLIFYSTEARAYALVMTLTVGSTLALLEALEQRRPIWWIGYAALSCAAVYTHYTAVFVLAVQLIWAFIRAPRARTSLLLANAAAVIAFVPWIPALVRNTRSFGTRVFGIIEPLTPHAIVRDVAHWAIGHPYLTLSAVPGSVGAALILAGLACGCGGLVAAQRTRPRELLLPALLAIATPAGLALYSAFGNSVWDMRNLIVSWPGLSLVAGSLLMAGGLVVRSLAATLALVGFGLGGIYLQSPAHQRPDYAGAAKFVLGSSSRSDPVAVVPAPTPGPLSAIDAAFAYAGDPGRALLRVGGPPLAAVLHAPPYALLQATSPTALARQALLGPADKLFVVAPGRIPVDVLLGSGPRNFASALGPVFGTGQTGQLLGTVFHPLSAFLKKVAVEYRPLETKRFPGFLPLSVYVLARRSGVAGSGG